MVDYKLQAFDPQLFLKAYWQKQPGVFPAVFHDFQNPITADELAGLALEPGVDSRVISCNKGKWDLKHGPFDDYASLGNSHWTLLVQAVNEHYPPSRFLLNYFDWLPDWRIDDLMVSYATPQAGVGAHIDQYDVFIIQGQGSRRWQVGKPEGLTHTLPHPELKQVSGMVPFIDVVLETGDMLYIPAGFPHQGVSLDESLSFSVGFRAPSQAELLSAYADLALDQSKLNKRFTDTKQSLNEPLNQASFHLNEAAVQAFQRLMLESIQEAPEFFKSFIAGYLSQNPRPPLQFWPDTPITEEDLQDWLLQHETFLMVPGVRWVTTEIEQQTEVFFQGHSFSIDEAGIQLLIDLKQKEFVHADLLVQYCKQSKKIKNWLLWLVNEGYLVSQEELEGYEEAEAD